MQVLTGQYPTLYTHKFRIFYSDFIPDGVRNGYIFFLTLKPTYEVLAVKLKQQTLFTGPSTPMGNILIIQEGFGTFSVPSTMAYVTQPLNQDINPTSGSFVAASLRTRQFSTPAFNLIANQSVPYQIGCYLGITSGSGTAALTGGSIDIWVTTMKMP